MYYYKVSDSKVNILLKLQSCNVSVIFCIWNGFDSGQSSVMFEGQL